MGGGQRGHQLCKPKHCDPTVRDPPCQTGIGGAAQLLHRRSAGARGQPGVGGPERPMRPSPPTDMPYSPYATIALKDPNHPKGAPPKKHKGPALLAGFKAGKKEQLPSRTLCGRSAKAARRQATTLTPFARRDERGGKAATQRRESQQGLGRVQVVQFRSGSSPQRPQGARMTFDV